jgi:signal transduction histidine kinase
MPAVVFLLLADLGSGVIGGAVYTRRGLGVRAAEIARLVLDGTRPQDIPVEQAPLVPTFDWRQIQRWTIDASRLPTGSDIRFKAPTVWELYRWYIIGTISVVALQTFLIGGLLVERVWRHRAEREAQRTRDSLAHLGRVSVMGELAASLAHELNQPLTGILGNARAASRLLDADPDPLPKVKKILADIVEDDRRAGDMITGIRELVSKRTSERTTVDVNDVVQGVSKLVTSDSIVRQVSIGLELAPAALMVEGNRVQLQQMILNLIVNALEAASAGERVPHRVVISTDLSDRQGVHLVVRDNGPGLVAGEEGRLFEPFYTTKESGMGMGLAIVRSIVESHDGRVWAANAASRGAEFHVVLPRLASEPGLSLTRRSA